MWNGKREMKKRENREMCEWKSDIARQKENVRKLKVTQEKEK